MFSVVARFYPFGSEILLTNRSQLLMQMISNILWVTLSLGVTGNKCLGYKCTIVQIHTHYDVFVDRMF